MPKCHVIGCTDNHLFMCLKHINKILLCKQHIYTDLICCECNITAQLACEQCIGFGQCIVNNIYKTLCGKCYKKETSTNKIRFSNYLSVV